MSVEVVEEKWRPRTPELEYFRQNREDIRSYQKDETARQAKALDRSDSHLSKEREKYRLPNGVTKIRIWPKKVSPQPA